MKKSTLLRRAAAFMMLTLVLCATAKATDVLSVTTGLTLADPTQQGRLSRNGIPQDWANTEPFPGAINLGVTYHYHTFVIDPFTVALGNFFQISIDDPATTLFASAYFTSYDPNTLGFDTNWLGDAGTSGNFFGVDPLFFQVTVPLGESLVVVVNNTGAGNGGVGHDFNLLVESFSDTDFSPAHAAPDAGSSALLLGLGLAGLVFVRRSTSKGRQNTVAP
jgi:hypothetical protein